MKSKAKSFLLPFLLTIVALLAAMHLRLAGAEVPRAEAQTCPNTECHGYQMCRYNLRVVCAIHTRDGPCTAWLCQ
jgi:hypothetical protein